MRIYCSTLEGNCCSSCHEDEELGYGQRGDYSPPDKHGYEDWNSKLIYYACCTAPKLKTRAEWAAAVRAERARRRADDAQWSNPSTPPPSVVT